MAFCLPPFRRTSAFNPASLFLSGSDGFLINKIRPEQNRVFQDDAGTTLADEDLDPIGLILDDSPNGNNFSQSTESNKPQLQIGTPNLAYVSTNDYLVSSVIPSWTEGTVICDFTPTSADDGVIGAFQAGRGVDIFITVSGFLSAEVGSVTILDLVGDTDVRNTRVKAMLRWDASLIELYNGASLVDSEAFAGAFPTVPMYLGALNSNGTPNYYINADIFFAMGIDRKITDAEWTQLLAYL